MSEINELWTTKQAAEHLGVEIITIHDLIGRGKLMPFHIRSKGEKLPWRTWVRRSEVEALKVAGWRERAPRAKREVEA
jgi:hypothetical protein